MTIFGFYFLIVGALWIGLEIYHNYSIYEWSRGYVLWRNVIVGAIFWILGIASLILSGAIFKIGAIVRVIFR